MISTTNLSKSFTTNWQTVVIYDKLNWSITEWSSVAIMWPSGSGKSTLLNLISGLDIPDDGEMIIWSTNVSILSEDERALRRSKNIAFIFQSFHLIPNLTVEENIDLVIDIAQVQRRFTTSEILTKVWLSGYEKRYPHQLSGWEQQRVAIARAFVWQLPILLADEPTGNLDHRNALHIMELMMGLQRESGVTIIIITHDATMAKYADTIYELSDGQLLKE